MGVRASGEAFAGGGGGSFSGVATSLAPGCTGTDLTLTDTIQAGKVQTSTAGGKTGAVAAAGAVSGTTGTYSGAVAAASVGVTGALAGATLATTGNGTVGGTLGVTGATTLGAGLSGTTSTMSGAIAGASVAATGALTGATLATTGKATVAGPLALPGSANQAIALASDTVLPNASNVYLTNGTGALITLTSTPNISTTGVTDGQELVVHNVGAANSIAFSDLSVVAGSKMRLVGASAKTLGTRDTIKFVYNQAADEWRQIEAVSAI